MIFDVFEVLIVVAAPHVIDKSLAIGNATGRMMSCEPAANAVPLTIKIVPYYFGSDTYCLGLYPNSLATSFIMVSAVRLFPSPVSHAARLMAPPSRVSTRRPIC